MAATESPTQTGKTSPDSPTDKDLASIAEARSLVKAARRAQPLLAELSQEQIDAIVAGAAAAILPHLEVLAQLAVEETGYGVVADKVQKNRFAAVQVPRLHQTDEDRGGGGPYRGQEDHRDCRAVRRGRRRRALHEPDVDRDL
jgi:acyl-CoA reductase-like NAD-dependent aldehyde dehydrogenase